MRYRLEIIAPDGSVIWAQVGTVNDSGVWLLDLEMMETALPGEIAAARIKWGKEADA